MGFDPITAIAGIQAVVGAASSIANASYQSAVARNNATIAERRAADARVTGSISASRRREQTAGQIGTQRATLAANGVLVDQGSALDLTVDTAGFGELDALTIRSNAERRASGFEEQAVQFEAEGRNARRQGAFNAFGSVLSGASTVAGNWQRF